MFFLFESSLSIWNLPDAAYLLQGFKRQGINAYAISVQNEPQYSNPTFPTSTLTAAQGELGVLLKSLMKANGFPKVKLIGKNCII